MLINLIAGVVSLFATLVLIPYWCPFWVMFVNLAAAIFNFGLYVSHKS